MIVRQRPKKHQFMMFLTGVYSKLPEIRAELARREFAFFVREFWDTIVQDPLVWNWHIEKICTELQFLFERARNRQPKLYDLIINIPPGTTKSTLVVKMFPVWCWVNASWLSFICGSYSGDLALEHADKARDLIRSEKFKQYYPHLKIPHDKDNKSNYQITERVEEKGRAGWKLGGQRFSTSVGGTITGMHGHFILIDDPLNPNQAVSSAQIKTANDWMDQTLSTRKTDKEITVTVLVMQRLHQDDPTGHILKQAETGGRPIKHICLPGELVEVEGKGDQEGRALPEEWVQYYKDGLLDPQRLGRNVLSGSKLRPD